MLVIINVKAFITGIIISIVGFGSLAAAGLWYYINGIIKPDKNFLSPIVRRLKLGEVINSPKENTAFKDAEILNVLLVGIDRRDKSQTTFNTDVMILVSVNPATNKVLLTSVPRDLWINGNKINALYAVGGPQLLIDAFEQITGQKIQAYVVTDFEDFKWLGDSFGGIPVYVQKTFTDNSFPNNSDTAVLSVTFIEGAETMSGERALTFARSRKGNNGEGSDLMRAKRQHLLLRGLINAVKQPNSKFWPMDIETFYNAAVAPTRMTTTLSLSDAKYLWDFYKDKDKYQIESFVVDDRYVYHPGLYPNSAYRAWVFVPKDGALTQLRSDIVDKLSSTQTLEATAPPLQND
ncbi:LCP family protein [candidate division WWE3 bacterium]|nr:LCP family protein [candidate division WWE3 bacterium]